MSKTQGILIILILDYAIRGSVQNQDNLYGGLQTHD